MDSLLEMYARAVDDAAQRLRDLRREEWEDIALAALAVGLALAATQLRPSLALPLFLGGLSVAFLGVRALWRRWDLVERLAGERDAHAIPEVRSFAAGYATLERRRGYAALIRARLTPSATGYGEPAIAAAEELTALAGELEDADLDLDPACAVACMRLLTDLVESPLLNPALPPDELRSRVRRIRSGFEAQARAA